MHLTRAKKKNCPILYFPFLEIHIMNSCTPAYIKNLKKRMFVRRFWDIQIFFHKLTEIVYRKIILLIIPFLDITGLK